MDIKDSIGYLFYLFQYQGRD